MGFLYAKLLYFYENWSQGLPKQSRLNDLTLFSKTISSHNRQGKTDSKCTIVPHNINPVMKSHQKIELILISLLSQRFSTFKYKLQFHMLSDNNQEIKV